MMDLTLDQQIRRKAESVQQFAGDAPTFQYVEYQQPGAEHADASGGGMTHSPTPAASAPQARAVRRSMGMARPVSKLAPRSMRWYVTSETPSDSAARRWV